MPLYNVSIFVKEFKGYQSKQTYLDVCKWLAVHIFGKPEIAKNISVSIDKTTDKKVTIFTVTIYVKICTGEVKESFCKKCKTLHTVFYSVDHADCDNCKANAYFKELEKNIKGKADFFQKILEEEEK